MSLYQMEFPEVVGSDIQRAKLIIKSKLGRHTPVRFLVQPYRQQRSAAPTELSSEQTIVLWHDQRYNAVAITPRFLGRIYKKSDEYY
jgi:hypothetical protein